MAVMPEQLIRKSIIARSPSGNAVLCFDNVTQAERWVRMKPNHRLTFYEQTITEISIEVKVEPPLQLENEMRVLA